MDQNYFKITIPVLSAGTYKYKYRLNTWDEGDYSAYQEVDAVETTDYESGYKVEFNVYAQQTYKQNYTCASLELEVVIGISTTDEENFKTLKKTIPIQSVKEDLMMYKYKLTIEQTSLYKVYIDFRTPKSATKASFKIKRTTDTISDEYEVTKADLIPIDSNGKQYYVNILKTTENNPHLFTVNDLKLMYIYDLKLDDSETVISYDTYSHYMTFPLFLGESTPKVSDFEDEIPCPVNYISDDSNLSSSRGYVHEIELNDIKSNNNYYIEFYSKKLYNNNKELNTVDTNHGKICVSKLTYANVDETGNPKVECVVCSSESCNIEITDNSIAKIYHNGEFGIDGKLLLYVGNCAPRVQGGEYTLSFGHASINSSGVKPKIRNVVNDHILYSGCTYIKSYDQYTKE